MDIHENDQVSFPRFVKRKDDTGAIRPLWHGVRAGGAKVIIIITRVPVGSGFQANWTEVGSGGFRVPGRNPISGFQWVPGSGSEPQKWVPVGSGFRPNVFFCADP